MKIDEYGPFYKRLLYCGFTLLALSPSIKVGAEEGIQDSHLEYESINKETISEFSAEDFLERNNELDLNSTVTEFLHILKIEYNEGNQTSLLTIGSLIDEHFIDTHQTELNVSAWIKDNEQSYPIEDHFSEEHIDLLNTINIGDLFEAISVAIDDTDVQLDSNELVENDSIEKDITDSTKSDLEGNQESSEVHNSENNIVTESDTNHNETVESDSFIEGTDENTEDTPESLSNNDEKTIESTYVEDEDKTAEEGGSLSDESSNETKLNEEEIKEEIIKSDTSDSNEIKETSELQEVRPSSSSKTMTFKVEDEAERQALYDASVNATYTSTAWSRAVDGYKAYPEDDRFKEALELAADRNISYAEHLEGKGKYDTALWYFNRVINGPWISAETQAYVQKAVQRIALIEDEAERQALYEASVNATYTSTAWSRAVDGYNAYPEDERFKEALELAADRNISYAEHLEGKGKYDTAQWYFNRVINGPWISAETQAYVQKAVQRIALIEDEAERQALYESSVNATYTSDAWSRAVDGYNAYPEDERFKEALELAADRNISYAEHLEGKEKYNSALWYFNRVINGPWISAETQAYVQKAVQRIALIQDEAERQALYESSVNATYTSDAWSRAVDGYNAYPEDDRFKEALELAADRNISYAEYLERKEKYDTAQWYFNRVINGPWISEATEKHVTEALTRIGVIVDEARRESMYKASVEADGASEAWLKAIDGYNEYPEDDRFKEALELAADRNIGYAESLEGKEKYDTAQWYYNRILRGPWISEKTEKYVHEALTRISEHLEEIKKETLYNNVVNEDDSLKAWDKAVDAYGIYPEDGRFKDALKLAAARMITYAENVKGQGDAKSAESYLYMILEGPWVSEETRVSVSESLKGVNGPIDEAKRVELYNSSVNAGASEAWLTAIEGYEEYPDDDRFKEALELAAARNIEYAESLERRGKLETALWYFNRVTRGPWLSEETLAYANEKADGIKTIIDTEFIYEKALNAESLTEKWSLSVEGHMNHTSDSRLQKLVQETAVSLLSEAFKEHKNQNFSAAAELYELLVDAPEIVSEQKTIAKSYVVLASEHVTIDKATYHLSLYNHTLSEALDEQMRYSPKSDGAGKVLATRDQTEYYLNPKNFVSLNGVNNEYTVLSGLVDASALNVRSGIGTDHSIVTTVIRDTKVKIVNYEDGWYNVHINIGDRVVEGWVSSTYIKVESRESESRDLFEAFYPVATVTADSLNVRQGPGVSHNRITSVSKNRTYRILDQQNGWYNIQISSSVSGWVSGDFVTVSKNINRSALQFLKLSGSSGISAADLNEELAGKGILDGTGESFRLASQNHNINEVYLMAHAEHESGNGTSRLSTGVLVSEVDGVAVEPRTVYNMYGIYAFDDSALKSGSEYAYKKGWFTPEEAIIGGAEWISSRYINHETHQQDTLYKMRWNPAKPGVHQYATHIAWSQIQTSTLNTLVELSQKYDLNLHFDIPKYN